MYQKRKIRKEKRENSNQNEKFHKVVLNWYPGHMAKAKREIKEKLDFIDIVYEIIDARMPISSRIPLDEFTKNKEKIIIVTKYDLCDQTRTDEILKKLPEEHILTFDLKSSNKQDINNLIKMTNTILKPLNDQRVKKGLKPRTFRALVVGAPNVGKSTLINRIRGKNVQITGNKAGVTKSLTWIKISNTIELLDTPGILYPKITSKEVGFNLASLASINENILNKEEISNYIITTLKNNYPSILETRYNIKLTSYENEDIFNLIGKSTNSYKKGMELDRERIYTIIMNDLKEGRIKNITLD